MSIAARWGSLAVIAVALLGAGGCGDSSRVPEVVTQTPMSLARITVRQTGSAAVTIDPGTVSFATDAAGTLVVKATVRSGARQSQTIIIRASIFDPSGTLVGDATGGQVAVSPGQSASIQLNGPAPHGTIASATFEVTSQPSPTAPT